MDASKLILTLIKDDQIKHNLNPLIYYALKLIYSPKFSKRCKYFGKAIKRLFDELGNNLDLQIATLDENLLASDNKLTFDMSVVEDMGHKETIKKDERKDSMDDLEDFLNVTANKNTYKSVNKLMKSDWRWCFNHLVDYDDEYILDKDNEDYTLLDLIKEYLFSNVHPKESSLMMCYNILVSSIELFFCFKLILSVPKFSFMKKEEKLIPKNFEVIQKRIEFFYDEWIKIYWHKYKKNILIREIIGNKTQPVLSKDDEFEYTQQNINLTMCEPILNSKYISFTKLIKEGPFCFDIEEAARQICIIDHELLSSLTYKDYSEFMIKKEMPESFEKFFIREKQIQCYILIFITMHNNLENKKNMIQNFIALAHILKTMNNQQTCSSIITAFSIVSINKKKLLWKLIEKKYRDIYNQLEKETNDMELNENPILKEKKEGGSVPHIRYIIALINNMIIQSKGVPEIEICNEYKELIYTLNENAKNKYLFFKMNPLYDFFLFGFLEIFKPKKWNLKSRFDFSNYTQKLAKLDQLLNYLVKNFQNVDL